MALVVTHGWLGRFSRVHRVIHLLDFGHRRRVQQIFRRLLLHSHLVESLPLGAFRARKVSGLRFKLSSMLHVDFISLLVLHLLHGGLPDLLVLPGLLLLSLPGIQ